jgi:4-hydroxyacetophenone monooxygenase
MNIRPELRDATDATIEDALAHADPMALRGLLYQLTGDETVAATKVELVRAGNSEVMALAPREIPALQAKAARYLTAYRDRGGVGELSIGPADRLPRSLGLTAGVELPDAELPMWLEELALDPWARGLRWRRPPSPERLSTFSVLVIGAGLGGLNAAVQLEHAGIPYTVVEKNSGVGGTWFENRYPGARVDTASRSYTHIYGVDFEYPNPFCAQVENEKYFNWIADTFGVRKNMVFDTEVRSAVWDESAGTWEVVAYGPDGPRTWRPNAIISAVGFLSRPNVRARRRSRGLRSTPPDGPRASISPGSASR